MPIFKLTFECSVGRAVDCTKKSLKFLTRSYNFGSNVIFRSEKTAEELSLEEEMAHTELEILVASLVSRYSLHYSGYMTLQ